MKKRGGPLPATSRFPRELKSKPAPGPPARDVAFVACLLTDALGCLNGAYACRPAFSGWSRMAAPLGSDGRLLQTQQRELYWIPTSFLSAHTPGAARNAIIQIVINLWVLLILIIHTGGKMSRANSKFHTPRKIFPLHRSNPYDTIAENCINASCGRVCGAVVE